MNVIVKRLFKVVLVACMAQRSKPMTPAQKAKFLSDKHNTLAIMSEIIRLRHAVEGKQSTDEEILMEAGESLKKSGSYLSKIQKIKLPRP